MGRAAGRQHAACDLYRNQNDSVVAIYPGTVLRNAYLFYEGTDALEVQHSGGFVVRYGEVSHAKTVAGIKAGTKVNKGEIIGYVGKTNCCTPMLHFELYSGSATGSLTTSAAPYERRSDLMNPSTYLTAWEFKEFGANW